MAEEFEVDGRGKVENVAIVAPKTVGDLSDRRADSKGMSSGSWELSSLV